jgi:hypothetical protein
LQRVIAASFLRFFYHIISFPACKELSQKAHTLGLPPFSPWAGAMQRRNLTAEPIAHCGICVYNKGDKKDYDIKRTELGYTL